MQTALYFDECKWVDAGEGLIFEFVHESGEKLATVSLRNAESKLWQFEVNVPPKYQAHDNLPRGVVYTSAAARRVAETILLSTILLRS